MNELEKKLNDLSHYWQNMDRSDEAKRIVAEEFYKNELMPVLIDYFLEKNKIEVKCDVLILPLGNSYEPLVFSILALKPEKVLILCTKESQKHLDNVIEFTKLKPSQYSATVIDRENPLQLYQKIKEYYEQWGKPENIYVDFTGGTKAMAAGCAMAGSLIKAKLVYIVSEEIKTLKKPKPGTERLVFVEDPYKVFGDLDKEKAISLFNSMDYLSAYRIFDELDKQLSIKHYSALKHLAKAYDSWDSLDFDEAISNLSQCIEIASTVEKFDKNYILNKYKNKLHRQMEILKILKEIHSNKNTKEHKDIIFNNFGYLIANLYQNAMRREKQEKYEMASLLLYRVLEAIEQKRLWNYGIDTSNADYSVLPEDEETLLNKVNGIVSKIKGFYKWNQLDDKIDLLKGYILLAALDDEIVRPDNPGKEGAILARLSGKVKARNNSIFAHGYEFIDNMKYKDFKEVVDEYVNKFCVLEKINKELFDACEFINL